MRVDQSACRIKGLDRYDRSLADVRLPGRRNLGVEMARSRMAWHFKR